MATDNFFVGTLRCNAMYRRPRYEEKDGQRVEVGAVYETCGQLAHYVKVDPSPRGKLRVNAQFRCGRHLDIPEKQDEKELPVVLELWDAAVKQPNPRRRANAT